MKIYLLEVSWGEYADKESIPVGVFSSSEIAEQAQQDIMGKGCHKRMWPWCNLPDMSFGISELELDVVPEYLVDKANA